MAQDRWQTQAACLGSDPDLFFATDPADQAAARRVCGGCPVATECLDHALTHSHGRADDFGIWGGTDAAQRHKLRAATAAGGAATSPADPPRPGASQVPRVQADTPAPLLEVLAAPDGTWSDASGRVVIFTIDRDPRWAVLVDDRMVARCGSLAAARAAGWRGLHGDQETWAAAA